MEANSRRSRVRSFAIGGVVGAAGVLAAVRRSPRRLSRRPVNAPAGLAAFEDAPCFLELVGAEAARYRETGGETADGAPGPA